MKWMLSRFDAEVITERDPKPAKAEATHWPRRTLPTAICRAALGSTSMAQKRIDCMATTSSRRCGSPNLSLRVTGASSGAPVMRCLIWSCHSRMVWTTRRLLRPCLLALGLLPSGIADHLPDRILWSAGGGAISPAQGDSPHSRAFSCKD